MNSQNSSRNFAPVDYCPWVLDIPNPLRGSGDNPENRYVLQGFRGVFCDDEEFEALCLWVSTFYGFQQGWLLDRHRFSALTKCRQIGGSHTLAAAAILWGLVGETTSIISIGEREAAEVLEKSKLHARALVQFGSKRAALVQSSAKKITLKSGGRVLALPSTSGARGMTGNVILDELAYYTKPHQVWDAAAGSVLHGYRLRVCSTPNGSNNLFYQVIQTGEKSGYRLHSTTVHEAMADGMAIDLDECWSMALHDPRIFGQLFECQFLDDALQYVPSDLLREAFGHMPDDPLSGIAYGGLDIGESKDKTVLTIVRRNADQRWLQHIETHRLTDDRLLDKLVAKAFEEFGCRKVAVDATGLGSFPAQRMRKQYGPRLMPVKMSLKSKEDLATGLYDALSSHQLSLPNTYTPRVDPTTGEQGDQIVHLRNDIFAVRRMVTPNGNVRYDAETTSKGHADRAFSLMLSLHAAGRQSAMLAALKKRMASR